MRQSKEILIKLTKDGWRHTFKIPMYSLESYSTNPFNYPAGGLCGDEDDTCIYVDWEDDPDFIQWIEGETELYIRWIAHRDMPETEHHCMTANNRDMAKACFEAGTGLVIKYATVLTLEVRKVNETEWKTWDPEP